jgi:hypothetical protein
MSRDLLEETIIATDKGMINEGDTMSYPPNYTAGSCPEQVGDITINQTVIDLGADKGRIKTDRFEGMTGNVVDPLSFDPLDSYPVEVSINGIDQAPITDYTIAGRVITLVGDSLVPDDVVMVRYAYEVII